MTTALMTRNGNGASIAVTDDPYRLAETFVRSGFFADAKDASQAVVKILAGRELGFGPMASMTGVHVIKGKVALSANLLGAAIKRSGRYDYRVAALDDDRAELVFFEGGQEVGRSAFTMDDAKRAGLLSNPTWKNYPRNMLLARALSNGARWFCPDVFGGAIYTPDELGAEVDGETGDVIEHVPAARPAPAATANMTTPKLRGTEDPASAGEYWPTDDEPPVEAEPSRSPESWRAEIEALAQAADMRGFCEAWPGIMAEPNHHRRKATVALWAKAVANVGGPDDISKVRTWLGASPDRGDSTSVAAAAAILDGALAKLAEPMTADAVEEVA